MPVDLRVTVHEVRSLQTEARAPATQMGHAPTMTLETYGHIIEELGDTPHVSAEAEIGEARRQAVNFLSTKNG